MSQDDFDVDRLAAYLHLNPQQVSRLADRGRLPGRKVGGQWRFPQGEIHHWLEKRIGLSDEEELIEVESVLQQSAPSDEQEDILLTDMLPLEAIAVPLLARTRNSVISSMVELAAQTGWLWDTEKMSQAVHSREEMHSTALENGIALLHPRRPLATNLSAGKTATVRQTRNLLRVQMQIGCQTINVEIILRHLR
jgi:PTS system nitrogen regulatory IIA component